MNRVILYIGILISFGFIATGCCDQPRNTNVLSPEGWLYEKPISFDISGQNKASLRIMHSEDYGWENLYLRIVQLSSGNTISSEVESILMNDGGVWIGESCGDHRLVFYEIRLQDNVDQLQVFQYSRSNPLTGLVSVGLLL